MAVELHKACEMCFRAWNRITKDSAISNPKDPQKTICKECRQDYSMVTVAKVGSGYSKWVEVRDRPHLSSWLNYQICRHIIKGRTCHKSRSCTYAHTDIELKVWFQDRIQTEPPRDPGQLVIPGTPSQPFQHCTFVLKDGICPQGVNCPHPHSQRELQAWNARINEFRIRTAPQLPPMIDEYRFCKYMFISGRCSMGKDCTFAHSKEELQAWQNSLIRTRPVNFQVGGYRLCRHVQTGHRCLYGNYCTFAHSRKELDEWNRQLENAKDETQDFAYLLREKIIAQHQQANGIQGFEESKHGVTISELNGHSFPLQWQSREYVQWMFEVSAKAEMTLHSVILFDPLTTDFTIEEAAIAIERRGHKEIKGKNAHHGVGRLTKLMFDPLSKICVKVSLKPRSGIMRQLVLFDFGSLCMVRPLQVHVLSEKEAKILESAITSTSRRPERIDLHWEEHQPVSHTIFHEETDRHLPSYPLPEDPDMEKISREVEKSSGVTKENYKLVMHNLLFLEEYHQRKDMSRYDLSGIEVSPQQNYESPTGTHYATEGYHFIEVPIDEGLFGGGRSIREGDGAYLLPLGGRVLHECHVEQVRRESVILKILEQAKQDSALGGNKCSIRFFLVGVEMRAMHYAVDRVSLDSIFPTLSDKGGTRKIISKCFNELETIGLYDSQKKAVASMLDPQYSIPSLVLGAFGCGKTYSLRACIQLLLSHDEGVHILVCTHSNSAADIYVEAVHKEWKKRDTEESPSLLRVCYTSRRIDTLSLTVRRYCRIRDGHFKMPTLSEIKQSKIVVTTLSTSRALSLMGMPKGHFNFIFIDEAAQALEPESIIPLCLADQHTKIVLAGDHMQMDAPVYSPQAQQYGLQKSLLERLYDHEAYYSEVGQFCKTFLTENHRSRQEILDIPSKLFYKNMLTCKATFCSNSKSKEIPPVQFIGVDGQESQDEDSPSYYNDHEAIEVAKQIQRLISKGIEPLEICVVAYYTKQVQKIRKVLRSYQVLGFRDVCVMNIGAAQGKEFQALLVSTVRTCSSDSHFEEKEGFLSNAKLFNTAVTRAREWLIVIGEPITLCTIGSNCFCWLEFIKTCMKMDTFQYPCSTHFESFLETRHVVRQSFEKYIEDHDSTTQMENVEKTPAMLTGRSSSSASVESVQRKVATIGSPEQEREKSSSSLPSSMEIDGGKFPTVTECEPPEKTAFTQCHPHLRQYLTVHSVFPYLVANGLLTETEMQVLVLPTLTNYEKVDKLVVWLLSKPNFFVKFIRSLRATTNGTNHDELADVLEDALREAQSPGEIQKYQAVRRFRKKGVPTGNILGRGSFGSVIEIEVEGKIYAAKRFREDIVSHPEKFCLRFCHECAILCQLSHPHIVQYYGYCQLSEDNYKLPLFVMEKMDKNLHEYLLDRSNSATLLLVKKVAILHNVADGLLYLHSRKPAAVIHRDLTAKNVLLDSSVTAKIGDFGNSRLIDLEPGSTFDSMTSAPGTLAYMAPEALTHNYDAKVDVFSFGHLALFTVIQEFPSHLETATYYHDGQLEARTEEARRKKYMIMLYEKVQATSLLANLIRQCLKNRPGDRPSSAELAQILSKIKQTRDISHTTSPARQPCSYPQTESHDSATASSGESFSPVDIN